MRIATFNTGLNRKGPGLLLRDILKGEAQVLAVAKVIARSSPDILLLTRFDYDYGQVTATAFRDLLQRDGLFYPQIFSLRPNSGWVTGLDVDGDGRLGEPEDAQGYGAFSGQSGMVILSKVAIDTSHVRDFSHLLWRDLPGNLMLPGDKPGEISAAVAKVLRLSSVGHWVVPITHKGQRLHLMAFHATTPVFDGPKDRNGRRNHDEILFWQQYLDGQHGTPPNNSFVMLGTFNLDPNDGEGRQGAIRQLLADPRLQDPAPQSAGAARAGQDGQSGDPALDTADWQEPTPGNLRVDYVLPSSELRVTGAGVDWPATQDAGQKVVERASAHRLVWVDLEIDGS